MSWATITGAGTTTATKFHGDAMNKINNMFNGTDVSDTVSIHSNVIWTFENGSFKIRNPADTFSYLFTPSAIAADRTITLPLLTGNDTIVTEAHSATLTNKTFDANGTGNSITNIENADIAAGAAIDLSKLASDPLARANHTGTQLASTVSDFDTQVRTSRLDQMTIPTALINLNGNNIDNIQKTIFDITAITSSTTIALDFNTDDLNTLTLTHNTTFSSSNLAAGKQIEVHIASASAQTLAFPAGWTFYGDKPTTTTAGKDSVLYLTSLGSADSDVKAVFVEEA